MRLATTPSCPFCSQARRSASPSGKVSTHPPDPLTRGHQEAVRRDLAIVQLEMADLVPARLERVEDPQNEAMVVLCSNQPMFSLDLWFVARSTAGAVTEPSGAAVVWWGSR